MQVQTKSSLFVNHGNFSWPPPVMSVLSPVINVAGNVPFQKGKGRGMLMSKIRMPPEFCLWMRTYSCLCPARIFRPMIPARISPKQAMRNRPLSSFK